MQLECRGARVTGTQTYMAGNADKNESFDLFGSFEDLILNLTWHKNGSIQVGTATLKYDDRQLDGHGLSAVKGKAYASRLTATKD
jgi:hypothetical protein